MKSFINCLIFFMVLSTYAQIKVTGTVVEKGIQTPLEFAEVILEPMERSSSLVGAITGTDGSFLVNAKIGTYTMKVIFVGEVLYTKELNLTQDVNLGVIKVDNSQALDAVILKSKKKLIVRKVDRLVFNVENSIKAGQGDAIEVLKITPGVRVQNDNISLIGKSNLTVMVNDKIVRIPPEDLVQFLRSISSEDIKNIEVITTPPAKYEASGNSGFINITLKKTKKDSWNAKLTTYYLQRRYPTGNIGGTFNYNKNKLSIASSINKRDGTYYQEQDNSSFFTNELWATASPLKLDFKGFNARADINYKISDKWSMGAQYLYGRIDMNMTDSPRTLVYDNVTNEINRSLLSDGRADFTPVTHSVNFNNEFKLDTLGRNIVVNLDYFKYNKPDVKTYNGVLREENPSSQQFYAGINSNEQDVRNASLKVDVEYPVKWFKLSMGGKVSQSESLNNIFAFNSGLVNNPVTQFPTVQNNFTYTEDIQALYFSVEKEFNSKWSSQFGIRMEATQTNSKSDDLSQQLDNDYTKLFPSLYISYNFNENSTLTFSYNKRIERPGFLSLNPNTYFSSPFQSIEGNPFLQPSFVDNIELVYSYKNFITKFYYSNEDNLFAKVPLADNDTNEVRFTLENFIERTRYGFSENYTFNKVDWLNSTINFDLNYSLSSFSLPQSIADQKGFSTSFSIYNDLTLNTDETLFLGVNYWHEFAGVDGIYDTRALSSFSMSLYYLLLDKNLSLSLTSNDIFKSAGRRTTTNVNGVFQQASYYYDNRSIQLSISYKFGNNNIRAKRHRTGNSEEKKRAKN